MTGNAIENEGTKAVIEMLKINTTLTSLNLSSKEEQNNEKVMNE